MKWWNSRVLNKKVQSSLDRIAEIEQAKIDQQLELIQIALSGLVSTQGASEDNRCYRMIFKKQYDTAIQDLETLANRITAGAEGELSVDSDYETSPEEDEKIKRAVATFDLNNFAKTAAEVVKERNMTNNIQPEIALK